jgi:hypothetical protein
MEIKPERFYNIYLSCQGFSSLSRAKNIKILELSDDDKKILKTDYISPTHRLIFYDCTCGSMKDLVGCIEKDNEEIVFSVSPEKKFIIKELTK